MKNCSIHDHDHNLKNDKLAKKIVAQNRFKRLSHANQFGQLASGSKYEIKKQSVVNEIDLSKQTIARSSNGQLCQLRKAINKHQLEFSTFQVCIGSCGRAHKYETLTSVNIVVGFFSADRAFFFFLVSPFVIYNKYRLELISVLFALTPSINVSPAFENKCNC